jgi:LacI family transcriptional regulator/LacI family repressor for deo operon, udp, cdd, tsx, nupC, and nupG
MTGAGAILVNSVATVRRSDWQDHRSFHRIDWAGYALPGGSMSVRDVAARAGVSPATVSRVFTAPETVAVGTRRRVLEAADELSYTPNPVARSLARGRTGNVGIVVPDMANAWSAMAAKAVQQEAGRAGFALFVAGSDELIHEEERLARAMAPQVDGLLLASPMMPDAVLRELAARVPVVLLNRLLDGVPSVLNDATEATTHAVEHLFALGHRRLVYLAGPEGYSNDARRSGFQVGCGRLGLTPDELGPFPARFASGMRAADQVLATRASAVLAYSDDVAVGLIGRLADRGVRVPADLSVIGYDDTSLAGMVTPRLTTVRLSPAAAGQAAMRRLAELMRGGVTAPLAPIAIQGELIVRSSTGPYGA